MHIGVIADVHANAPALRAVLDVFDDRDVDAVVCAGDVLGHNGFPEETLRLVRGRVDALVLGNHDRRVLPDTEFTPRLPVEQFEHDLGARLSPEQKGWLADQPLIARPADLPVVIAHARPSLNDPSGFTTGRGGLGKGEYVEAGSRVPDDTALVLGHTHRQAAVRLDKFAGQSGLVINPGSVGDPFETPAEYALVDTTDWSYELASVEYDSSPVRDLLERHDLASNRRYGE
jgi:predicted phosphodiesterase